MVVLASGLSVFSDKKDHKKKKRERERERERKKEIKKGCAAFKSPVGICASVSQCVEVL